MNILAIIPARGGSKGVPRKNIKPLHGRPLLQYTIEQAVNAQVFKEIMVSTEDAEIVQIAKKLGAQVPHLRPAHLAGDESPTIDTVRFVLTWYRKQGRHFDAVCLLQPTNPLRQVASIKKAVALFSSGNTDSLISVRTVPHAFNPHWVFVEDDHAQLHIATGEAQIIPRRQELPPAYYRDGSIYLTRARVVLDQGSLYGQSTGYLNLDGLPHINLDTMQDWEEAERLMES